MLHQADAARERGEALKEVEFLQRYLLVEPDDVAIRERFAKGLRDTAKTERAKSSEPVRPSAISIQETMAIATLKNE